jgi:hypothetical protein
VGDFRHRTGDGNETKPIAGEAGGGLDISDVETFIYLLHHNDYNITNTAPVGVVA